MSDGLKPKNQPTGDYAVGRCRPPQHTRWQKGQSGNSKGRPKRKLSGNVDECVNNALAETAWVEIGGKKKRVTNADKVALVRIREALQGKPGAARDVYRWQKDYRERKSADGAESGLIVIEAELVFDGEEDRGWNRLAKDKEALEQLVEQLQAQLAARGGPHLLPPPDSTENSA
jgi:hypothetical protein